MSVGLKPTTGHPYPVLKLESIGLRHVLTTIKPRNDSQMKHRPSSLKDTFREKASYKTIIFLAASKLVNTLKAPRSPPTPYNTVDDINPASCVTHNKVYTRIPIA